MYSFCYLLTIGNTLSCIKTVNQKHAELFEW